MIPKDFIALTCIARPAEPFTIHIRTSSIEAISRIEQRGVSTYTSVSVPSHNNGGYKVSETPEEVLDMIAAATGRTVDVDTARLLVAVWKPTMDGHLHVDEVAKYLQRPPADVKRTYVHAQQLAKEAK